MVGEHSREILTELGVGAARVDALIQSGAVADKTSTATAANGKAR